MVAAIRAIGEETNATGPDPAKPFKFRYKVVDLDDLEPSHHANLVANPNFPKELQPRMRTREASRQQILKIASKLQPDALIDDFKTLDRGPMIVGPDNVVESGNGRTIALLVAREEFPARYKAYTDAVRARAVEFGIEGIEDIDAPVLVRERLTDIDRVKFTALANQSTVLTMSPVEQALQDAGGITDASLSGLQVGETQSIDQALRGSVNRPMVTAFLARLPENERAALIDSQGNLNQTGLQRIKAAIFTKVFPGEEGQRLTTTFFESVDPQIKTIESSLFDALPQLAKAEGLTKSGQRVADLSLGEDLAKSVDMLARLKQEGMTVEEFLGQSGLFERELTPHQEKILAYLGENGRSRKRVREGIKLYAIAVQESPHPDQGSFFGDARESKSEILERIFKEQGIKGSGEDIGLFALAAERERAGFDRKPEIKAAPFVGTDSKAVERVIERAPDLPKNAGLGTADIESIAKMAETRKKRDAAAKLLKADTGPPDRPIPAAPNVKYSDIPFTLAERGHRGTSFVPDKRAAQEQNGYVAHMESVWKSIDIKAITPEQKTTAVIEFEKYREGYADRLKQQLVRRSSIMSTMVTGRGNFPVERMNKKNDADMRKTQEFMKWDEKAQGRLLKAVVPTTGIISADEPNAPALLQQKIDDARALQVKMKAANKIIKRKTPTSTTRGTTLTAEDIKIGQLVNDIGLTQKQAEELMKPDFAGRLGFPAYEITSVNANIKRMEGRQKGIEQSRSTPATADITFKGGTVVDNTEANRVQIFFDEKPDTDTRTALKRRGFKWAPSQGAWQRQRGPNTIQGVRDALNITTPAPALTEKAAPIREPFKRTKARQEAIEKFAKESQDRIAEIQRTGVIIHPIGAQEGLLLMRTRKFDTEGEFKAIERSVISSMKKIEAEYALQKKAFAKPNKAKVKAVAVEPEPFVNVKPLKARSEHAIRIDKALQAEGVADASASGKEAALLLEKWKKHPNRYDLEGVDTFTPKRVPRAKPFRSR